MLGRRRRKPDRRRSRQSSHARRDSPDRRATEWVPFSIRSFMCSNGVTSATSLARRPRRDRGARHRRNHPRSPIAGKVRASPARRRGCPVSCGEPVDILGLGGGHDAVDHGRRESGPRRRSRRQAPDRSGRARSSTTPRTTAPFSGRLSQVSTVKGRSARRAAPLQARAPESPAPRRGSGIGQIMGDIRDGRGSAAPVDGFVAIALFGDRQRDDPAPSGRPSPPAPPRDLPAPPARPRAPRSPAAVSPVGAQLDARYRQSPAAPARRAWSALCRLTPMMPQSPPDFCHRLGDIDRAEGAEERAEAQMDDADTGSWRRRSGAAGQISGQASLHRH